MKDKYELHLEGDRMENESFSELKKIVERIDAPYEIYLIRQSKMNTETGLGKLDDEEIEDIQRLLAKGYTKTDAAKKYKVTFYSLTRALLDYDKNHKTRPI